MKNLSKEKATLIWCCKEAVFKWHQTGGVDLIKDIIIPSFILEEKGQIKIPKRSDIGQNLLNSTNSKNDIRLFLKDF